MYCLMDTTDIFVTLAINPNKARSNETMISEKILLSKGHTLKIIPEDDIELIVIASKKTDDAHPTIIISHHSNDRFCSCVDCIRENQP